MAKVIETFENAVLSSVEQLADMPLHEWNCYVGSIAGLLMDEAVIDNCTSTAVFKNYDASCGGIAGNMYGGVNTVTEEINYSTISNCTFAGSIEQVKDGAMAYIGGIAGNSAGNIKSCVNEGQINFTATNVDSVGGIAGYVMLIFITVSLE